MLAQDALWLFTDTSTLLSRKHRAMASPGVFIREKRVLAITEHLLCANLPAGDFTCNNHSSKSLSSSHYTDAETDATRLRNSPGWEEYLDLNKGLHVSRVWEKTW